MKLAKNREKSDVCKAGRDTDLEGNQSWAINFHATPAATSRGAKGGEPGVTFVHVDYNCDLCRFSAHPRPDDTPHTSLSLSSRRPFPLYSSVSSSSSPFPPLTPPSRKARSTTVDGTRVIKALLMVVCIVRKLIDSNLYDKVGNTMNLKRFFRRGCFTLNLKEHEFNTI